MKRTLALSATATAAVALVLTGCSSSHDSDAHSSHDGSGSSMSMSTPSVSSSIQAGAPASGPHNDADASFARDMIPHHRQAVEMADMALTTSTNADVLTLARQIKAAQDPEIATMTGWLEGWNQPVPSQTGMADMGGSGHAGHSMHGMMTPEDMAALGKATGTAFDKMFLTMMIEHHEGAVLMAKTVLAEGRNTDATSLAKSIIATQTTEIATMTKLAAAL